MRVARAVRPNPFHREDVTRATLLRRLSCQTLCMNGNRGMASGWRNENTVTLRVVARQQFRSVQPVAVLPSLRSPRGAACGSAKPKGSAPAAVSCATRRSRGRASGTLLS